MFSNSNSRVGSWGLAVIVVVAAAAAWGVYAWRHALPTGDDGAVAERAPQDSPSERSLVSLRAERPRQAGLESDASSMDDQDEDVRDPFSGAIPAGGITANAPPGYQEPVEMTLAAGRDPAPTVAGRLSSSALIDAARSAAQRGDLLAARRDYSAALAGSLQAGEDSPASPIEEEARRELNRIADAMIFSRAIRTGDPSISVHEVAPGDTLYAIAGPRRVTQELLARINQLADPHRLNVGQRIKIVQGPFHARISKSRHLMDVYLGDVIVRSYRVGLGTNGGTPTGEWVVQTKLVNPDWTDPVTNQHYLAEDPDNPIGERWMGLEGVSGEAVGKLGFGIHGTIDPASIGQNMSMGCIRMTADDVAEVYGLLVERHSRVTILP